MSNFDRIYFDCNFMQLCFSKITRKGIKWVGWKVEIMSNQALELVINKRVIDQACEHNK